MWDLLAGLDGDQRRWVAAWHDEPPPATETDSEPAHPHRALYAYNFRLWHEEDQARDPSADDHRIARVKRAIDRLNQLRNDAIETLDERLLAVSPPPATGAVLHSETPGCMVDRLFINALKLYHMREAAQRPEADGAHREKCLAKAAVLEIQRTDLLECLERLHRECLAGERFFKVYRQMKMYNDAALNPVLYGKTPRPTPANPSR